MNKAHFIKKLTNFHGDARLYRCEDGELPEYVAVSGIMAGGTPETYIFQSDSNGIVTDWLELPGSFRGSINHAAALANVGYEIVGDDPIPSDNAATAQVTGAAINNHTCPTCGNKKCNKQEKSCWKCGNKL